MNAVEIKWCFILAASVGALALIGDTIFGSAPSRLGFAAIFAASVASGMFGFVFGKYGELEVGINKYDNPIGYLSAGFLASLFGIAGAAVGAFVVAIGIGILK